MRTGRSTVIARRGMIATGHPLATAAGLEVLADRGNAVDAAVAAAAVLGVAQPMMSGLGGDTFMLVYHRPEGRVWGLNGSGPAPAGAGREYFVEQGRTTMPLRGMLAVSVPGAVRAMEESLARWGSGRFSLRRLLEPAIRYAEEGVPVAGKVAGWLREAAPEIAQYPSTSSVFMPRGRPLEEGEILVQRDLGASLRMVAAGGSAAFYEGPIAAAIGAYSHAHGGLLSSGDFTGYSVDVHEPLSTTFRDLTVYATAPPSQGILLLEMLNILEGFEPARWDSPDAIHRAVEAKKIAYADRLAYLGDPLLLRNPVGALLDKAYSARRREEIGANQAAQARAGGLPAEEQGDTTYFCVADCEGNLVSFITSLSAAFGCCEIVEGTGILLNNRAGRGFTLEAGHPNCIAPGKRTMHTLTPYMAFRGGMPWLVWGTPGGDAQPQWNLQILFNLVESGTNLQQAVEAPRWHSFPGTDPATLGSQFELRVEEGLPPETLTELERRGHRVITAASPEGGGGAQAILVDHERGAYLGASDPRVDGCAMGF